MFFSLVFIVVAAILESERIIKLALNVISRQSSSIQPTLDLRLIGAQTRSEIQSVTKPDTEEQKTKPEKHIEKPVKQPDETKLHKPEEKYMVLIPTTGKVKKKLGKVKSNDITVTESTDNNNKKHVPEKPQKRPVEVKTYVPETECQKRSYQKEKKIPNKKEAKQIEVVQLPYEEETSSTTTESSNNEEMEKPIKLPLKKSNSRSDNQEQKEIEVDHPKIERKRSGQKQNNKKEMKENIQDNKIETPKDHKLKPNKNQKERREKQHANPKKTIEKTTSKTFSETMVTNNSCTRVSPSIPSTTIWGENRATFSDVVARSEQASTASRLPQTQSTKPTMYVEPYKQSNSELGPIGSRKENYWSGNVLPINTNNDQFNQIQMPNNNNNNNNFFEHNNVSADNTNNFLDLNSVRDSSILNFMQPNMYQQSAVSQSVQGNK